MKKLILAVLVMAFIAFLPVMISAQTQVASWDWDGDSWEAGFNGKCFASLPPPPESTYCNKNFKVDVKVHASVAQWIKWYISGRRWDWFVRKPGNYGADCITANLWSNQNIEVQYRNFGPLIAEDPDKAVYDTIWIWYAVDPGALWTIPPLKGDPAWVRADSLNFPAEWDTVWDSAALHSGIQFKLWNYIHVVNCNSACEYQDHADITLKLLCQKAWIDTLTGDWLPDHFWDNWP